MTKNNIKEKLVNEFNYMKALEEKARDFYIKVSSDPTVKDEEIRNVFREIAKDEERHSEIVQKIINIINNNL